MGATKMWQGHLIPARDHFERSAEIYNRDLERYLPMPNAGVIPGRCQLAWTLWALGYPEKSRGRVREALSLARKLNRPYSMAFALQFAIAAEAMCGDYAQIRSQSEALIELSQQHGYPHWLASGKMSLGVTIVEEEDFDRGIALMREGMAGTREYGTLPVYRYGLALMAGTLLRAGNVEEGLRAVDEAAEGIEADQRFNEAEIWRLRGEFMLAKRQERAAAENFDRAIAVARAQQAKSWELRATCSLARMQASQDHTEEARTTLAPLYEWFTEGFDTNDLVEAKTILDRLRLEKPRR
jgi:predicted ATPase